MLPQSFQVWQCMLWLLLASCTYCFSFPYFFSCSLICNPFCVPFLTKFNLLSWVQYFHACSLGVKLWVPFLPIDAFIMAINYPNLEAFPKPLLIWEEGSIYYTLYIWVVFVKNSKYNFEDKYTICEGFQ